jgi:hypothetical protein
MVQIVLLLLYNKRLFLGRKLYWLIICLTQTAQRARKFIYTRNWKSLSELVRGKQSTEDTEKSPRICAYLLVFFLNHEWARIFTNAVRSVVFSRKVAKYRKVSATKICPYVLLSKNSVSFRVFCVPINLRALCAFAWWISHRTESRCPNLWGESNTRNTQNFASHGLQSVRYIKLFYIQQKHHIAVISLFCLP